MENRASYPFKSLQLIISWGVWINFNQAIFQEGLNTPPLVVSQAINILAHFPQKKEAIGIHVIHPKEIDSSRPWGYFDGVVNEDQQHCRVGASLYLMESHFFLIKTSLGYGTNNFE